MELLEIHVSRSSEIEGERQAPGLLGELALKRSLSRGRHKVPYCSV